MPKGRFLGVLMKPPKGLQPRGRALWRSVLTDLPNDWELDQRELSILRMAASQADDEARLEKVIRDAGATARGSTGQLVVNPAIAEVRQCRQAVSRLLGLIELPDADEQPATAASSRGKRAADSRWTRRDQLEERRKQHGAT